MSALTAYPPQETVVRFTGEAYRNRMLAEWGLIGPNARKVPEWFTYHYVGQDKPTTCKVVGHTLCFIAVIEFPDGRISNIHGNYLGEMQSRGFSMAGAGRDDLHAEG